MLDTKKTVPCLNKKIALANCEAINIDGVSTAKDALIGSFIRSNNKDPEILLNIVFLENVNLSGLSFETPNKDKMPELLLVFVNNSTIDIGDIENLKAVETFTLDNSNTLKKIALKVAKFRNVSTLHVYFFKFSFTLQIRS
jgi:hypothetical protein